MAVVRVDALRSVAFGGISGSYVPLGSVILKNFLAFRIINNTNGDLFISLDGTTNNLFVPAFSFVLYDIATNAPPVNVHDNLVIGINTQFYVKQSTAPTSGAVYLEGLYVRTRP